MPLDYKLYILTLGHRKPGPPCTWPRPWDTLAKDIEVLKCREKHEATCSLVQIIG